jgi:thioredoxin-related protein
MFKKLSTLVIAAALLVGCERPAQANVVPEMDDFHWTAQMAAEKNIPIMIMFTAKWCEFCDILKNEVLNPMMRGGFYDGYAMYIRTVSIDSYTPLKFSATEEIDKRKFAEMYRAEITPTLIFVDSRGLPIADRIVGTMDTQLFAGMIHRSINQAYEKLGNPMRLPVKPEDMRRPLPGFPE